MFNGLMRQVLGALLFSTLLSPAQAAASTQVFSGTLGKMPIVLEISSSDSRAVTGRYFHQQHHRDLALNGRFEGQTLELDEGDDGYGEEQQERPAFNLQQTADGWQGQWQDTEGKTLDVQLALAKVEAPRPDTLPYLAQLYQRDLYEYLRLQGLTFKPGKRQEFMGYSLQWWSEPESKLSMFKLIAGYPQAQQQRLNDMLMGRLWSEVISYHDCMLNSGSQWGEFVQTVKPQFLSPAVLSVNISTRYACGGAPQEPSDSPLNIDVNSGHSLSLEDVLWLGQGQPLLHSSRDSQGDTALTASERESLSRYRHQVLTPWVIKQLKVLYPEKMAESSAGDAGCNYSDDSVWGDSTWFFTAKGIFLRAYFPQMERSCDGAEWSVLPYAVTRQHPGAVDLELPGR